MSAREFEVEATIEVCGIKSPLSLTVRYKFCEAQPGGNVDGGPPDPDIPAGIQITSIWRVSTGYMIPLAIFSDEQKRAIEAEILENN